MKQEAWFQPDIWATMARNFDFYFFCGPWIFVAAAAALILLLNFAIVFRRHPVWEYNFFPAEKCRFDAGSRDDVWALAVCGAVFGLYVANMYGGENSIFAHLDLMSVNTLNIFDQGVVPEYSAIRFSPLAFWDINAVYAVTHNYYLIHLYTAAKLLLILYLLYRLFDFVPVRLRFYGMALTVLLPSFFWLNSVIFPEQNAIIAFLLSLAALKKFGATRHYRWLLGFVAAMNWAIYTKETVILLYAVVAGVSLLANVAAGKIDMKSFLHPWRTAARFPVEYLIFWTALLFVSFYMLLTDSTFPNIYIASHQTGFLKILNIYKLNLLLAAYGAGLMLYRLFYKKIGAFWMMNEGLLCGALTVTYAVVFYFGIIPYPEYKTYYLVLSDIVLVWYAVQNTPSVKLKVAAMAALAFLCALVDFSFYEQDEGRDRREAVEFIGRQTAGGEETVFFMPVHTIGDLWELESWNSAFKHSFSERNLIFKNQMGAVLGNGTMFYPMVSGAPRSGDYVIEVKWRNRPLPEGAVKIFDNKSIGIYKLP